MRTKILVAISCLVACAVTGLTWAGPPVQKYYATPELAVEALIKAARSGNTPSLLPILGNVADPLVNSGDPVADKNSRARFVKGYDTAHSLDTSIKGQITLEVGEDKYPFPIPLVQLEDGRWRFDSDAGTEELINRRIGANELATIQSCLAFVDAQQEFYVRNVQKDPMQHFASRLISRDGKQDGLYWPTANGEAPSPLGEEFARAHAEGYLQDSNPRGKPFHGYIYRLLTRQGAHAKGGAYDYIAGGELLGGFALLAFPAEYGNSGVMTFMVNQDGVVYSRNLGEETGRLTMGINEFDPYPLWNVENINQ